MSHDGHGGRAAGAPDDRDPRTGLSDQASDMSMRVQPLHLAPSEDLVADGDLAALVAL